MLLLLKACVQIAQTGFRLRKYRRINYVRLLLRIQDNVDVQDIYVLKSGTVT